MRIVHRVGLHRDNPARPHLERLGIRLVFPHYPGTTLRGTAVFEIEESDILWEPIRALVAEYRLPDMASTKFTRRELETANQLVLRPSWHWSYPQPEDDFGYLGITYDTRDHCDRCGIGAVQKAPFRVLRQPAWGKRNIAQLNWVFDEYFVTRRAYHEVFQPLGIGCCEVVRHRRGSVMDDMLQLRVDTISTVPLDLDGSPSEVCSKCGRRKYLPVSRGPFPPFAGHCGNVPIMKTQEYFGSGGSAFRAVVVSNALYSAMVQYGIKGVSYYPVGERERFV